MVERHLTAQNPGEDKIAPFRQQAVIIARKKENKAEQLSDMRNQLTSVEEELQEKQNQLRDMAGDTILRGEEFKKYVNKLRGRSSVYKRHRAELAALKAEAGVLTRTLEVLSVRDKNVIEALVCFLSCSGIEIERRFSVGLIFYVFPGEGRVPARSVGFQRDQEHTRESNGSEDGSGRCEGEDARGDVKFGATAFSSHSG